MALFLVAGVRPVNGCRATRLPRNLDTRPTASRRSRRAGAPLQRRGPVGVGGDAGQRRDPDPGRTSPVPFFLLLFLVQRPHLKLRSGSEVRSVPAGGCGPVRAGYWGRGCRVPWAKSHSRRSSIVRASWGLNARSRRSSAAFLFHPVVGRPSWSRSSARSRRGWESRADAIVQRESGRTCCPRLSRGRGAAAASLGVRRAARV